MNKLKAPNSYKLLNDKEKKKIVNKCGPEGFLSKIIPNSLLGLDISESCNIHDYMIHASKNKMEIKAADKVFLENMSLQNKKSNWLLKPLRSFLSKLYFLSVRIYSNRNFWRKET